MSRWLTARKMQTQLCREDDMKTKQSWCCCCLSFVFLCWFGIPFWFSHGKLLPCMWVSRTKVHWKSRAGCHTRMRKVPTEQRFSFHVHHRRIEEIEPKPVEKQNSNWNEPAGVDSSARIWICTSQQAQTESLMFLAKNQLLSNVMPMESSSRPHSSNQFLFGLFGC